MFNFEISDLDSQNIRRKTLQMVEYICDEFQLKNDFGTLSLAVEELIDQILWISPETDFETSVGFFIEPTKLSLHIHHNHALSELKKILYNTDLLDDTSLFTISQLTDEIEFYNEDQDIAVTFHVKPNIQYSEKKIGQNQVYAEKYSKDCKK